MVTTQQGLTIAAANFDDLPEIADVHVKSWQETYKGLVPQSYLDALEVSTRLEKWQVWFRQGQGDGLILARIADRVVGFISFGQGRDQDRPDSAEIYALYLLKENCSQSLGYQLYQAALGKLKADGFSQVYLWVLDTNRNAIEAYLRWGGGVEPGRMKTDVIGDQVVQEISIHMRVV